MTSRSANNRLDVTADDAGRTVTGDIVGRTVSSLGLRRVTDVVAGLSWAVNSLLLASAFGWIFFFGQARGIVELIRYQIGFADPAAGIVVRDPSRLSSGVTIGIIAAVVAVGTAVVMLASLFVGCARFRTTRIWLVFMAIVCGWLGLAVSWPTVYWLGQQQRMKAVLPAADAMVQELLKGWPKVDGELPGIGAFLAYPIDEPMTLMPLGEAKFAKTMLRFSAVERTGNDVMRFELGAPELGAWLERRGDGSEPQTFIGGLDTHYVPVKVAKLSADWFLVRYRVAGLAERGIPISPQVPPG